MKEYYEIIKTEDVWCVFKKSSLEKDSVIVATFVDEDDATLYAKLKEGRIVAIRKLELDRIKENLDRIFDRL